MENLSKYYKLPLTFNLASMINLLMANLLVPLIFLVNLSSFSTSAARNVPSHLRMKSSSKLSANYIKVCDARQFSKLGLDMSKFPYCNSSLSFEFRVFDLVARMTLAEKVAQMGDSAAGVSRIGLPRYEWWSEALHGVSNLGPGTYFDAIVPGATSFPTVIQSAASFNKTLWKAIGQLTVPN